MKSLDEILRENHPNVDAFVYERPDSIRLMTIRVDKNIRRKGHGTAYIKDLINYADKVQKMVTLSPSGKEWGSNKSTLISYYKRFGFIENKGRHKNYRINDTMYRLPQKNNPEHFYWADSDESSRKRRSDMVLGFEGKYNLVPAPRPHEYWYHGAGDIVIFRPGKPAFFTRDINGAKWFYTNRDKGKPSMPMIIRAKLIIRRPARLVDLLQAVRETGSTEGDIQKYIPHMGDNEADYLYVPKIITNLRKRGFDGFVGWDTLENTDIQIAVPFDLNQIVELKQVKNPVRKNPADKYGLRQYVKLDDGTIMYVARIRLTMHALKRIALIDYLDWLLKLPGMKALSHQSDDVWLNIPGAERVRAPHYSFSIDLDNDRYYLSANDINKILEEYDTWTFTHKATFMGTMDESGKNYRGYTLDLVITVSSKSMSQLTDYMYKTWPGAQSGGAFQRYFRDKSRPVDIDFYYEKYLDSPAPKWVNQYFMSGDFLNE
jgi:hypothetical protein